MKLKDIAAVSGRPGLFKIIKPTANGVIVEPFGSKAKTVISANQRLSILKEISVYVTGKAEDTVPLTDVFTAMKSLFPEGIEALSDPLELKQLFKEVLPAYDREKVYVSDIKKMVSWYNLVLSHCPEALEPEEEAGDAETA